MLLWTGEVLTLLHFSLILLKFYKQIGKLSARDVICIGRVHVYYCDQSEITRQPKVSK